MGNLEKVLSDKIQDKINTKDSLISLISKMGEKITIRRTGFLDKTNNCFNFSYVHTSLEKNVGKLGVILSIEAPEINKSISDLGHKIAMHIAASNPLATDETGLDKKIIEKEEEIVKEQLKTSGKKPEIIDKIAKGKMSKFISENTLLNQAWIMDPDKKVKDIIKEIAGKNVLKIKNFIRYKVGEGI